MSEGDQKTIPGETRSFEAEVSRLLHMMVHSVYADRDVFLRELISNAADACERLRMLALQKPELAGDDTGFRILLGTGERLLTIEDNGIGMDRDELVANLGTIARSGTRAFLEKAEDGKGSSLIGQFGVGFYSAFMVADKVEVYSTPAGAADRSWLWTSDGKGTFTIEPAPAGSAPKRGTRVELHLREEAKDYAEQATLERIVAAHSSHVPVPIAFKLADGEKQLGDGSALWRKPKAEVKPEEYREFYGHVSGQFDEPALTLHYRAEGRTEYSVLLFVPSAKPFDLFDPDRKGRLKLYVRRVFITGEAEILPPWLRFVRGVIDSEDLPLNISRETLQKNPILEQIGKAVSTRVLAELEKLAKDDKETFEKVWDAFGAVLKEGLYEEPDRRDALFKTVRFRTTTHPQAWRTLADYVAAMRPNQTAIHYALGESQEAILASPHLEGFARRGIEVLLLSDPIDAFWVRTALGFEGKPFQSVTQGNADLSLIPEVESSGEEKASDAAVATLAARLKEALGEKVSEVRSSSRLAGSPVCLVAPELGLDRRMEKILAQHQPGGRISAPVLEVNPAHPLIRVLAEKLVTSGGKDEIFDDAAVVLFGQARILDGDVPEQPADYAALVSKLLLSRLA